MRLEASRDVGVVSSILGVIQSDCGQRGRDSHCRPLGRLSIRLGSLVQDKIPGQDPFHPGLVDGKISGGQIAHH